MTRISQNQLISPVLQGIAQARERVSKYSQEITTGLKVSNPGDSDHSGSISQFRDAMNRIEGYKNRVSTVKSTLTFQDDILGQAEDLLVRAKEIAEQAANETNGPEARQNMAAEVLQIRDHLVALANSTYQGKYIYGGTRDNDPPFDKLTYTAPATGEEHDRYDNDGLGGRTDSKSINITDNLAIDVNSDGDSIFSNGIDALERLGRALAGYTTLPAVTGSPPTAVAPDGTGAAYVFPTDFHQQTLDITSAFDLITTSGENDILQERIGIGGKLRRLETADSLLELGKVNTQELLDKLQNADTVDSASNLSLAQTALQASYTVSARVLNLSILDYI